MKNNGEEYYKLLSSRKDLTLHSWTHSKNGRHAPCLNKIKPAKILAWMGKVLMNPHFTDEELGAHDGCLGRVIFLWGCDKQNTVHVLVMASQHMHMDSINWTSRLFYKRKKAMWCWSNRQTQEDHKFEDSLDYSLRHNGKSQYLGVRGNGSLYVQGQHGLQR